METNGRELLTELCLVMASIKNFSRTAENLATLHRISRDLIVRSWGRTRLRYQSPEQIDTIYSLYFTVFLLICKMPPRERHTMIDAYYRILFASTVKNVTNETVNAIVVNQLLSPFDIPELLRTQIKHMTLGFLKYSLRTKLK